MSFTELLYYLREHRPDLKEKYGFGCVRLHYQKGRAHDVSVYVPVAEVNCRSLVMDQNRD